jgi:hypothetical protein
VRKNKILKQVGREEGEEVEEEEEEEEEGDL